MVQRKGTKHGFRTPNEHLATWLDRQFSSSREYLRLRESVLPKIHLCGNCPCPGDVDVCRVSAVLHNPHVHGQARGKGAKTRTRRGEKSHEVYRHQTFWVGILDDCWHLCCLLYRYLSFHCVGKVRHFILFFFHFVYLFQNCVDWMIVDCFLFVVCRVFFEWKYNYSPDEANRVNSLVYLISAIASPFLGYVVDKTGKNVSWVILSIIGTFVAHALLNFSQVNPYTCMILMGFSYAMLAGSLWPLIALVVEEHQLGTAYGM